MNISEILKLKFPNINLLQDVILQDDGNGPYIKEWNIEGVSKPTKSVLDRWSEELDLIYRQQLVTQKRQQEYIQQGVTAEALMVALVEKLIENRPEALDALQAKRLVIKQNNPKPTV